MNADTDPRIAELEALATEEGFRLPYPADYILFLEDSGRIVDLVSGEVIYAKLVPVPTASAQAVVYLLAEVEGKIVIT